MVVQANRYLSFLMRSILVLLMCGSEQRQAAVSAAFGKRASSLWDLGASNFIEVAALCHLCCHPSALWAT